MEYKKASKQKATDFNRISSDCISDLMMALMMDDPDFTQGFGTSSQEVVSRGRLLHHSVGKEGLLPQPKFMFGCRKKFAAPGHLP